MPRRLILIILVIAALAGGGWFAYRQIFAINRQPLAFYGNVEIREVSLGFRVPGRIAKMHVDEGDRVKTGQTLAQLDQDTYRDDLALRKASVDQQAAVVAKLEAGNRPAEIEQARANVTARRSALTNAKATFLRQQQLTKRDVASKQALDNAQSAFEQAAAQLLSAEEALKLMIEGPRKEDIAAAKASLEAAKAQVAIAARSLSDTELKAPADGIVLTRAVEPGAIVAAGTVVYTLSLEKPVWVRAYVPEPDLGLLKPGLAVRVFTDTRPNRPYLGQIGYVSPVAEFTPKAVETPELRTALVYRFRVVVKDADHELRQGMPVTVRLGANAQQEQAIFADRAGKK